MLVHFLDGLFRYFAGGHLIPKEGSNTISHGGRYTTQRQSGSEAAHGIRASAKPEQKDAIARLPHLQDRSVAVDDV